MLYLSLKTLDPQSKRFIQAVFYCYQFTTFIEACQLLIYPLPNDFSGLYQINTIITSSPYDHEHKKHINIYTPFVSQNLTFVCSLF